MTTSKAKITILIKQIHVCRTEGPVINDGGGQVATNWEKHGSETYCVPPPTPPQDRAKLFALPLNG